ncbi:MAG: hypothetical protein AAFV53_00270 [Myxococcota bacterium]
MSAAQNTSATERPWPAEPPGGFEGSGWTKGTWDRFNKTKAQLVGERQAYQDAQAELARVKAEIERLKASPPAKPAAEPAAQSATTSSTPNPAPAQEATVPEKTPQTTPATNPEMAAVMKQLSAMHEQMTEMSTALAAEQSRNAELQRQQRMGRQDIGITDPTVQKYLLRDYAQASEGAESPPDFESWLSEQRNHPLYKSHFAAPAGDGQGDGQGDGGGGGQGGGGEQGQGNAAGANGGSGGTPGQPPTRRQSRPNQGRGAPPSGSQRQFTGEEIQRMDEATRRGYAHQIAQEALQRGDIKISEANLKRLEALRA